MVDNTYGGGNDIVNNVTPTVLDEDAASLVDVSLDGHSVRETDIVPSILVEVQQAIDVEESDHGEPASVVDNTNGGEYGISGNV